MLFEILISPWWWLHNTQYVSPSAGWGLPFRDNTWMPLLCNPDLLSNIYNKAVFRSAHGNADVSSRAARKMKNSSTGRPHGNRFKQSMDSSRLPRHKASWVILGKSTEKNGGWWWRIASTSASPCGMSNFSRWIYCNTVGDVQPAPGSRRRTGTHPMWLVRNEISSSLRTWVDSWTLRLNFCGRK